MEQQSATLMYLTVNDPIVDSPENTVGVEVTAALRCFIDCNTNTAFLHGKYVELLMLLVELSKDDDVKDAPSPVSRMTATLKKPRVKTFVTRFLDDWTNLEVHHKKTVEEYRSRCDMGDDQMLEMLELVNTFASLVCTGDVKKSIDAALNKVASNAREALKVGKKNSGVQADVDDDDEQGGDKKKNNKQKWEQQEDDGSEGPSNDDAVDSSSFDESAPPKPKQKKPGGDNNHQQNNKPKKEPAPRKNPDN